MADTHASGGLLAQLQASLGVGMEFLRVRLALLGTELELEKHRISVGLFWAASALMSFTLAAVLLCALVIMLMWDGYRLAALGLLSVFFSLVGWVLLRTARRQLAAPSNLFSVSLAELDHDRNSLKSHER